MARDQIQRSIVEYFRFNRGSVNSIVTLWDAFKVVIRGAIINIEAGKRKQFRTRWKDLVSELEDLEKRHKRDPSDVIYERLVAAKSRVDLHDTIVAEKALAFIKQKYFEKGAKQDKLLAWRLAKEQKQNTISMVRKVGGQTTTDRKEISGEFYKFYQNVYTSQNPSIHDIHQFLETLHIPTFSALDNQVISTAITEEEIVSYLQKANKNKAPGLDGLSVEFYLAYKDVLITELASIYNHCLDSGELPNSWSEAKIVLKLKEGKDPTLVKSYRPISLLNTDYKILTGILARRLNEVICKCINPDQSGFIKGRQIGLNIRKAINIIDKAQISKIPTILLFLDATKAFDRVEWPYLFEVMKAFNIAPGFINYIRAIYSNPVAKIFVNRQLT